jgi:TonB family protein
MAARYENLPGAGNPHLGGDFPNIRDVLRHRGPLEATLPPTPIRELLAASGATLFVLATDAALVTTVRRAADQHPLFVVETWPELMEAVESGRCGIALIDAAVLGARVAHGVAALAAYADRLVTLVATDRTSAQEYVGFLSDGRIHRLVMKPLAIGATRLLIESSTARRLQLREEPANDDAPGVAAAPRRFRQWRWPAAAAAAVVVLLAVAMAAGQLGWWDRFGRLGAKEPVASKPAATVPTTEAVPSPADVLADHRAKAALARQEGRLAEPADDNALAHYFAILAMAPTDQEARAGVSAVVDALFTRAEEALLADSLEAAAAALDHVRRVDPASSRLAFLDAQLARALAALAAAPPQANAAPPPVAASPTELDSALSLATTRLRRGQLLNPAGDSAKAYLDRAAGLERDDPRVAALRTDLAAALIAAARLVFDSDVAAAANLATEARRLGVESAALTALESDVGAALAREGQLAERLDAARGRVQSGALFAPAGDSALDYLTALQTDAPDLAGLAAAWETFRDVGALAIQGTIASGEWAAADAQLAGLARAPGGAAVAAPLAADLAAARLQATYLATPAQASVLTLERATPAVYPPDALARGTEGWVDLEYVVDRSGQPRNVVVLQASPRSLFDAAALAAVSQYRYVPFQREGRLYERRLQVRVRFQLQR